ncbi:hypothetical protein L2E82_47680 [Cichorium intybus]|uniref:Uncharacterized protein n=1 Tax=Cichorium intybus TaxID=13427 RepID=A0ACB8YVD6_CICIN|nr:hypothetical protein L2E82_47680 [Cichorium intybus]
MTVSNLMKISKIYFGLQTSINTAHRLFLRIVSFSTTMESSTMESTSMESFSPFLDCWSYDALICFSEIPPVVQSHLKLAYVKICCYCIATAVGAYLHIVWNIGGLLTTFATLGCMFWLLATPPSEELKRVSVLTAFPLLKGASLITIFKLAIDFDFDPSILVSECIGGAITAACFSAAATLATRRQFLYLGGLLSSGVLIYFWSHVASKIFGGDALFRFGLCSGLLIQAGSLVVVGQVFILKILIEDFGWESDDEVEVEVEVEVEDEVEDEDEEEDEEEEEEEGE